MVAGGTEASICPIGVAGFTALTALSSSEDPDRASIPFDKERNGFVMGEGAGVEMCIRDRYPELPWPVWLFLCLIIILR